MTVIDLDTAKANYEQLLNKKRWYTGDLKSMSLLNKICVFLYFFTTLAVWFYALFLSDTNIFLNIALAMMVFGVAFTLICEHLEIVYRNKLRSAVLAYAREQIMSQIPDFEPTKLTYIAQRDEVHFVFRDISLVFHPTTETFSVLGANDTFKGGYASIQSLLVDTGEAFLRSARSIHR